MWKLDGTTLTNQGNVWRSPGTWIFRETSPQNYNIVNMKVRYRIFIRKFQILAYTPHIRQNHSTFLLNSTKNRCVEKHFFFRWLFFARKPFLWCRKAFSVVEIKKGDITADCKKLLSIAKYCYSSFNSPL